MLGDIDHLSDKPSENRGMTPRVFEYLFSRIRMVCRSSVPAFVITFEKHTFDYTLTSIVLFWAYLYLYLYPLQMSVSLSFEETGI